MNEELHGNAPDKASAALLIIDMINDMEFPEGEQLLEFAEPMAHRLKRLKQRFVKAGQPVIYANDNFGRWRSNLRAQVEHCLHDGVRGQRIAELLEPHDEDYFVLKPKHSAFYSTTLDLLLRHFQVQTLVVTGVATDICVLFTANDAYMRNYRLFIPSDCVAANTADESEAALKLMQKVLKADIRPSDDLDVEAL